MKYFSIKKAAMLVAASVLALSAGSAFAQVVLSNGPNGGGAQTPPVTKKDVKGTSNNILCVSLKDYGLMLKASGIYVGPGLRASLVDSNIEFSRYIYNTGGDFLNLATVHHKNGGNWSNRAIGFCVELVQQ